MRLSETALGVDDGTEIAPESHLGTAEGWIGGSGR